jgi:hypothetical protein
MQKVGPSVGEMVGLIRAQWEAVSVVSMAMIGVVERPAEVTFGWLD